MPTMAEIELEEMGDKSDDVAMPERKQPQQVDSTPDFTAPKEPGPGGMAGFIQHLFVPEIDDNDFEEWLSVKIPYILHPECNFCGYWDLTSMILIIYSCITIPYRLSFESPSAGAYKVIDSFVDTLFMIDMGITFRTGIKPADNLITKPVEIAKSYMTGWFVPDFMSSFPFDVVLDLLFDAADPAAARVLKIIRLGRMLKILRMVRLQRLLKKLQDSLAIKNGVMTTMTFGLFIMFAAHFQACLFFNVTSGNPRVNWALSYCIWANPDNHNADCGNVCDYYTCEETCCAKGLAASGLAEPQCDFLGGDNRTRCDVAATVGNVYCTCMNKCMSCPRIEQYVASLYWSLVTMTTLGYGDITPTNNSERAFCIYAMLVGACIFAYSVTNMCTLVHNLNPSLVYFRNRVDQLNDLMEFMHLPKPMRKRVMDFFFFKMNRSTVCIYNQDMILRDLSGTLREDVKWVNLHEILETIPFIAGNEKRFVAQLSTKLKSQARAPGDMICLEGNIAVQMFMLRKGILECTKEDGTVVATLGEGSIFSVGALFRASKHGFTATVVEFADLYMLTKYDFDTVLATFHLDKEKFFDKAVENGLVLRDPNEKAFEEEETSQSSVDSAKKRQLSMLRKQIKHQSEYIDMLLGDRESP